MDVNYTPQEIKSILDKQVPLAPGFKWSVRQYYLLEVRLIHQPRWFLPGREVRRSWFSWNFSDLHTVVEVATKVAKDAKAGA